MEIDLNPFIIKLNHIISWQAQLGRERKICSTSSLDICWSKTKEVNSKKYALISLAKSQALIDMDSRNQTNIDEHAHQRMHVAFSYGVGGLHKANGRSFLHCSCSIENIHQFLIHMGKKRTVSKYLLVGFPEFTRLKTPFRNNMYDFTKKEYMAMQGMENKYTITDDKVINHSEKVEQKLKL